MARIGIFILALSLRQLSAGCGLKEAQTILEQAGHDWCC